uniref:DUF676 domain-containing protein n=1 Tax=Acrobeloides nanus TaxID=290746 RepID=A0A914C097_9BILA
MGLTPDPVDECEYDFNSEGKFLDEDENGYKHVDQDNYERICAFMTHRIFEIMQEPPYNLKKVALVASNEYVENIPKDHSFIFVSENFRTAKELVVLIHGTGAVRAGQWSRRLIINESLDVGSQLPYIKEIQNRGWAVLVMNTNDNKYKEEGEKIPLDKELSATAEEHGENVWEEFVDKKSSAERIAVVAHSYGGVVISAILGDLPEEYSRLKAICLTDAIFRESRLKNLENPPKVCNWVASALPLGKPEEEGSELHAWRVSAGTEEHERSSANAMPQIFDFIEKCFADKPPEKVEDMFCDLEEVQSELLEEEL